MKGTPRSKCKNSTLNIRRDVVYAFYNFSLEKQRQSAGEIKKIKSSMENFYICLYQTNLRFSLIFYVLQVKSTVVLEVSRRQNERAKID